MLYLLATVETEGSRNLIIKNESLVVVTDTKWEEHPPLYSYIKRCIHI